MIVAGVCTGKGCCDVCVDVDTAGHDDAAVSVDPADLLGLNARRESIHDTWPVDQDVGYGAADAIDRVVNPPAGDL